jgi:hypothetical protein
LNAQRLLHLMRGKAGSIGSGLATFRVAPRLNVLIRAFRRLDQLEEFAAAADGTRLSAATQKGPQ